MTDSRVWRELELMLAEEQATRQARHSLQAFAYYMAPAIYRFGWHHDLLYRYLDDFAAGRRKRLIIEMPPGHGKSEGVSRNLPAYLLGRNPDARIIACSYTADLASEMNRDVQLVMDGERYARVFPGTRLNVKNVRTLSGTARRNSDIFDVVGRRGFYKCAGVGGSITGRRFDFGIVDDPVKDREAANSPVQREATWRWFTSVFSTRQAKDAGICLTSTRWHRDDLVGRIREKMEAGQIEPYDVLTLPALATGVSHPDDPRQPGDALWPWFKAADELARQRGLDPRDFAALYQQNPTGEGSSEWAAEMFDGIFFDDWPPDLNTRVLALDPSKGKQDKSGDYSAFVLLGLDTDWCLWVDADLSNTRTTEAAPGLPSIVEDGLHLCKTWQPSAFVVETNGFQELVADAFVRVARERRVHVPLHKSVSTTPKEARIRTIGTYLAQKRLRVRNTPGGRLLVQQLRDWPLAGFDDGPDSLALSLRMMDKLLSGGAAGKGGAEEPTAYRGW